MFLVRRPSARFIERFIERSRDLPLTYSPVGLADGEPRGYDIDETIAVVGRGRADFDRARVALGAWKHFDVGWVELFPRHASTHPGTVVAALIRHAGFWSLNGARVVYRRDESTTSFGFAYGTLTNHAEQGEEIFEVRLDPASEAVTYRLRAVSRPRAVLTRVGYPIVRALQARFRRDSTRVMTSLL
jgi:uncharacterized protein (UPF0548 family)